MVVEQQTAALAVGVPPPPTTDYIESWDGSSWTEVYNLNTSSAYMWRNNLSTNAFVWCTPTTKNRNNNGSSWTETTDMNTARQGLAGAGESTLCFSGWRKCNSGNRKNRSLGWFFLD